MRQWQDLTGQRFGMLVVLEQAESAPSGKRRWKCRCDCGKQTVVLGYNLTRGTTVSCGCKRYHDLTGQKIGRLTVVKRSEQFGSRGKRKTRLWECRCDCGAITYKATDTLTNPDISMCQDCAAQYALTKARENAGYVDGTQLSRITVVSETSNNASGVRGVYLDRKTGRYRARIEFQGKTYNLGTYRNLQDAIKARKRGEEEYFDPFIAMQNEKEQY